MLGYSFALDLPRPEDWTVMPVRPIGFMLEPFGFLDQNAALDVPPLAHQAGHCRRPGARPQGRPG